ncbi:hypothetical protein SteCoe_10457 [Stentor coeruleus]|uniref:Protein kinase domain-containing protein n=1 Tax=Stentor coeruleus TaxID=5963 RepID=A0A1R2CFL6_9CILI|nr:hypothetical protein SteCoe_10457 [Stentor coeruleus]
MIKNEDITTTATGQFPIQGTEGYIAPEIEEARLNKELNARFNPEKADVFSLGLVFLQMLTYENVKGFNTKLSHQSLIEKVNTITIDWAQMIITKMLELDPSSRYNFTQLLNLVPITVTPSVNRK